MKTWFVYLINGEEVGTWANNNNEAERNLRDEYGDVPMEFIGVNFGEFGAQPKKTIHRGMSAVDMLIATGFLKMIIVTRF